jgi:hypothetical protein
MKSGVLCHFMLLVLCALIVLPPDVGRAEVSLRNGDFFKSYTDLSYPGGLEMKIERIYNSKTNWAKGIFGAGWGSEIEAYIERADNGALLLHEYAGGANNDFTAPNFASEFNGEVAHIVTVAEQQGKFSGDSERAEYRQKLLTNEEFRHAELDRFRKAGLIEFR